MMSAAIAYHSATKYHPATIGQQPAPDWDRQPSPFKHWQSDAPVELAPWLPLSPNPFSGAPAGAEAHEPALGLNRAALSRLLFGTYGITGVIPGTPPLFLRASPSAGGLYPAELYVVSAGSDHLPAGLYGYDARQHRLIPLWQDAAVPRMLAEACYGDAAVAAAPLSLIVTGVFQRSSWRYGERGYRRVLLDTGHLLGNAALMAASLTLRGHLTTAFCDAALERLLRLDPAEEGALAVLALNLPGEAERPAWTALPSATGDGALATSAALHAASSLPARRPTFVPRGEQQADALEVRLASVGGTTLDWDHCRSPLADAVPARILARRSTRRFQRGRLRLDQLTRILACGYASAAAGLGAQPTLERDLLMTFVATLAVDGIADGVHYLAPHSRILRPVCSGDARRAVQTVCLGQELGRDAAAVVFHTMDLAQAVRRHGDRAYRTAHLDAGLIGERLDLGALAEGLGASGIGGFFDDTAADLLGIPAEQAIVYITVLGVPATGGGEE